MPFLSVNDKNIITDALGYLKNIDDWDEDVARYIAGLENIELTYRHWQVIEIIQNYYSEFQMIPMIRFLVKKIREILADDKINLIYVYKLYPKGPLKQACKIAGLPKPKSCIFNVL